MPLNLGYGYNGDDNDEGFAGYGKSNSTKVVNYTINLFIIIMSLEITFPCQENIILITNKEMWNRIH